MALFALTGRRTRRFLAVAAAALFMTSLAATPAAATYGPPQSVYLQVRGYSSSGYETQVGRVVGTLQFDDGNSSYWLSLVLCRQSSYTSPNLRVFVNGTLQHLFSGESTRRPDVCGGHGLALEINSGYSYGGVVQNVGFTLEGVYFDGSTATRPVDGRTHDNPYN